MTNKEKELATMPEKIRFEVELHYKNEEILERESKCCGLGDIEEVAYQLLSENNFMYEKFVVYRWEPNMLSWMKNNNLTKYLNEDCYCDYLKD